jgi:Na+/H+ antiporter NhaD/arsenite permease-like protein
MLIALVLIFIVCYLAIVFEHPLHLDKTVPALIVGGLMWAVLSIGFHNGSLSAIDSHGHIYSVTNGLDATALEAQHEGFTSALLHHMGKIAEILVFLIGAMAIVDLIDVHRGFEIISSWIRTRNKRTLLWIIGIIAFFLSAVIDNLTTTIVLISILRKILPHKHDRIWYSALVITAANAGGAWSPIGDVTTTMLWIGKQITTLELIKHVGIPAIICFVVPFGIASFLSVFNGNVETSDLEKRDDRLLTSSKPMLFVGLLAILGVPIFKTVTHLPPYLGMMLALAIVWLLAQYFKPRVAETDEELKKFSPEVSLSRIEMSSILFFLGILLAIAAFETVVVNGVGSLEAAAKSLETAIPNQNYVVVLLGILSAVIDNVPLVAAAMGMYQLPTDDTLWHFIAYAAGTGGSMLIIGSAAGVAAMGMEKIDFIWYLKKISWLTALGYFAGCAAFLLLN